MQTCIRNRQIKRIVIGKKTAFSLLLFAEQCCNLQSIAIQRVTLNLGTSPPYETDDSKLDTVEC